MSNTMQEITQEKIESCSECAVRAVSNLKRVREMCKWIPIIVNTDKKVRLCTHCGAEAKQRVELHIIEDMWVDLCDDCYENEWGKPPDTDNIKLYPYDDWPSFYIANGGKEEEAEEYYTMHFTEGEQKTGR